MAKPTACLSVTRGACTKMALSGFSKQGLTYHGLPLTLINAKKAFGLWNSVNGVSQTYKTANIFVFGS